MRGVYTTCFYLALPLILLRVLWRSRQLPQRRQRVAERFGRYHTPALKQSIWLHAVSYGEMVAAEQLIEHLLQRYPTYTLVITNMTLTGSQRTQAQFKDRVVNVYLPYDLPFAIKRFLAHFKPTVGIIMETELWPNLLSQCQDNAIPVILANARLSERSLKGYGKICSLTQPMLNQLSHICAQSETDAQRFEQLGAPVDRVSVLGNLKNDLMPNQDHIARALNDKAHWENNTRPVLIAASTHEGEEAIILEALHTIKAALPELLLILVPRHPERFDSVTQLCQQQDFEVLARSCDLPPTPDTDILLGDSMGEMYYFYALSDVALVAGSLVPIGGHNIIEPIMVGLPVLTGPHLFHIAELQAIFPAPQCRLEVTDSQSLAQTIIKLMGSTPLRQELVCAAQKAHANNQGALKRHLALIGQFVTQPEVQTA